MNNPSWSCSSKYKKLGVLKGLDLGFVMKNNFSVFNWDFKPLSEVCFRYKSTNSPVLGGLASKWARNMTSNETSQAIYGITTLN